MKPAEYHPSLHRLALATACVALLPICVGALVTTLHAGMAFLDWPSSDGHNMLLYPWIRDIAAGNTGKAVEHGHRLAGLLIGVISIGLAVVAWKVETRRWVRNLALLVLLGVILQGILGGVRVRLDDPRLAMAHGAFAALVFTLMAGVSLFTSKSWMSVPATQADASRAGFLKPLVCLAPAFLFVQYLLGGQLRHLGSGLHEHLGFAFISLVLTLVTFVATHRSGIAWLRRAAWSLLALLFVQMLLGAAAWITKFGFASTGYVAVQNSAEQTAFRTAHMVVGMLLFMNSVVLALRVFRIESLQDGNSLENRGTERELSQSALVARGGAG